MKKIIWLFIITSLLTLLSCSNHKSCSGMIVEMTSNGVSAKQLSQILDLPISIIKHPEKQTFSSADSLMITSIYVYFKQNNKLPSNLYSVQNKKGADNLRQIVEVYRNEELRSNQLFIENLKKRLSDIQKANAEKFVESEINTFKSIRFLWKNQGEISDELGEALPKYLDDKHIYGVFNDSCAIYLEQISRYREDGISRIFKKNIKSDKKVLNLISTDIRGFVPKYEYNKNGADICYQILASIEHAQDILFSPINWLIEKLPLWLMISITVILLVAGIICYFTGMLHLGVIDLILLVISLIVMFWPTHYDEIKESIGDQIEQYYSKTIESELENLNKNTNIYYDAILKTIKNPIVHKFLVPSNVMQAGSEKDGGINSGEIGKESCEEDNRTSDQVNCKNDIEVNDSIRG